MPRIRVSNYRQGPTTAGLAHNQARESLQVLEVWEDKKMDEQEKALRSRFDGNVHAITDAQIAARLAKMGLGNSSSAAKVVPRKAPSGMAISSLIWRSGPVTRVREIDAAVGVRSLSHLTTS